MSESQPTLLWIARSAIPVGWLCGLFATVGDDLAGGRSDLALIPGGLAIALRGTLMLTHPRTVLVPLARWEADMPWARAGMRIENRQGAVGFLIVGVGWMVMGVLYGR